MPGRLCPKTRSDRRNRPRMTAFLPMSRLAAHCTHAGREFTPHWQAKWSRRCANRQQWPPCRAAGTEDTMQHADIEEWAGRFSTTDTLTLIATVATFLTVLVAIWQLRDTNKTAEAQFWLMLR